jgi:pyruvate dehydrogenase E2 component (dihydrolipoamide acetyltransferase)
MATKVHMEALSPTMEEGQLVRWLKNEGDTVAEGDVLAEIETDKATMELVARGAGVLREVKLGAGETAQVGTVIAIIADAGEEVGAEERGSPNGRKEAGRQGGTAQPLETEKPKGTAPELAAAAEPTASPVTAAAEAGEYEEEEEETGGSRERSRSGAKPDGRVKASPLARRLASERGLELSAIKGSGPGGRITKADIEAAGPVREKRAPSAPAYVPVPAGPDVEEVPLSQMRKTIAKRLVTSIGPVPTFYLTIEVAAQRLVEARARVNERLEKEGVKTSLNDFIVKAVAAALARHPEVNASWSDSAILRHKRVHVGVAVAVEDGLITPVVHDANLKSISVIAQEIKELASRARDKKLKPEEYTGATFSVSNLGMFGIVEFTAIINPPESGIVAVGAVEEQVVAEGGQPVVRPRMRITMSCDHRVVDGATGARFLQTLRDFLEEPVLML